MDSKKSNKISEIVRLQQILKKWKKLANMPKTTPTNKTATTSSSTSNNGSKSIKFLKKTLSFSDMSTSSSGSNHEAVVPKGFLAVCVGKELKRFIIPTEYLSHQAFGVLLREAEEEFGFQQEGVLKIPCEVPVFEKILKMVQEKREVFIFNAENDFNNIGCFSPDNCELTPPPSHHPQLCR